MKTVQITKLNKEGGEHISTYRLDMEQYENTRRLLVAMEVIKEGEMIQEISVHTGREIAWSKIENCNTSKLRGIMIWIKLADEQQIPLPLISKLRTWIDKLPGLHT